jgi:integrase
MRPSPGPRAARRQPTLGCAPRRSSTTGSPPSARRGRKPRTLKCHRELVDIHPGPGLGHLTLRQLQDDATIQRFFDERKAWRDERGRGLSARTIQMIHDALRAAVNLAIKRGLMHRNPVGKTGTVEIPRPRRKVHVSLSFQEAEAFLSLTRRSRPSRRSSWW